MATLKVPPGLAKTFTRFGRALEPAVKPVAIGGSAWLAFKGIEGSINAWGAKDNPPAQTIPIDTNPFLPGIESYAVFDPRTGRLVSFGAPPSDQGNGPERSEERITKTAIYAGIAIAGLVVVVLAWRQ